MDETAGRLVAGAVLVDLVKFIKNYEKAADPLPLGPIARELLSQRVMSTQYYPLTTFLELLAAVDTRLLRGREERALEMGAAGGVSMRGLQKTYGVHANPMSSVLAMRHAWRAHYNFGQLYSEPMGDTAVSFTIDGYPDIPMTHALMTAGWGLAAARTAGASGARVEVTERPWHGAPSFKYLVHVR